MNYPSKVYTAGSRGEVVTKGGRAYAFCLLPTAYSLLLTALDRPSGPAPFDTSSGVIPGLFLVDALSFWQHALMKNARNQDTP